MDRPFVVPEADHCNRAHASGDVGQMIHGRKSLCQELYSRSTLYLNFLFPNLGVDKMSQLQCRGSGLASAHWVPLWSRDEDAF